jgi:hypothetical protein
MPALKVFSRSSHSVLSFFLIITFILLKASNKMSKTLTKPTATPFQWLSFFFFSRFFLFSFENRCVSKASKLLIAEVMQTFIVKSASAKGENQKPHFFALNKGLNSGKPLLLPCPNCFKIEAENEDFKEMLYWVSFALWKSKAFHPFLIGSVIPFIRIGDYKQLISEKLEIVKASPAIFTETIKKLQLIELKEKQFKENLRLIQELKRAYVYKYFNQTVI